MPSLSQPFRLETLPRIKSLSNTDTQKSLIQVADDFSVDSNKLTIGISGSAIFQYIINPTPSLVFNIPIPSTNNVSCCNVEHFKDESGRSLEIIAYCLTYGKSCSLNVTIKLANLEKYKVTENEILNTYTIKSESNIVNVSINKANNLIIATSQNGQIQFYDFQLKLMNSVKVSYDNIKYVKHFEESSNRYLFVLSKVDNDKTSYELFQLIDSNNGYIKEIFSTIIEKFDLESSHVCYQFGKLYRLTGNEITIYSLPQCQQVKVVTLPIIDTSSKSVISIKPVATNRLLLTVGNNIYVLDLTHNSILAERVLSHVKTFQLLKSAIIIPIEGNENSKTIALGVSTKASANATCSLEVINIDVGSGTLKDSLGKSFERSVTQSCQLNSLFESDEKDNLFKSSVDVLQFDYNQILKDLGKAGTNAAKFDKVFFDSLQIKEEHYTENDRFIHDQNFLGQVLDLIFQNFRNLDPKALTFLLTHPLFPVNHTKNLLDTFKDHPRLFKQAVVTCPNLPLKDLLTELFSITNGELSLDISLRVLQDYTRDSIKQELKKMSKVDIQTFIENMINSNNDENSQRTPQLYQLLSLVLDASGLFSLDSKLLEKLSQYIDKQVIIAERNNKLWRLLEDTSAKRTVNSHYVGNSNLQKKAFTAYNVDYINL